MSLFSKKLYKILVGLAGLLSVATLIAWQWGSSMSTGPLLISALICLAIGVQGTTLTKGLTFTVWIFAAVAAALFYPNYFISIGDFQMKGLIVPLLQLIMFGGWLFTNTGLFDP